MPFFILKFFSFLPFGGLLKSPKVIFGGLLIAAIAISYFVWKDKIQDEVVAEFEKEKNEEIIKKQQAQLKLQKDLLKEAEANSKKLTETTNELVKKINKLHDGIRKIDPKDDGPVAPVLKKTISELKKLQGEIPVDESERGSTAISDAVKRTLSEIKRKGKTLIEKE